MYKGERFNSITHLVGAPLAIAGLAVLVVLASLQGDPWKIVSFSVYGATLLILYLFSTLYHSLRGKAKAVFRKLDHAAIYLLIAGTYTPLTLVTLRGGWGWSLFGAVWGLAIFGIVLDSLPRKGRRILPIVVYLLMGWLVVIALRPLVRALPVGGIVWVVAGGLLYTSGIAFYIADKRIRHAHGVWHLFVLAGSATHYLAILLYLV
jgi:hemolysin III